MNCFMGHRCGAPSPGENNVVILPMESSLHARLPSMMFHRQVITCLFMKRYGESQSYCD